MPLTDADYNGFATSLVNRFADRVRGLDTTAIRLVGERPQDHVLAGFLTPLEVDNPDSDPDAEAIDDDELLATDLPRDSSYEQTSIGAEWLMPTGVSKGEIKFSVSGAVSVRHASGKRLRRPSRNQSISLGRQRKIPRSTSPRQRLGWCSA